MRRRVVDAAWVRDELRAYACRAGDGRGVAIKRVEIDRMVHVPRQAADNIRSGVVREDRVPRYIEDVEDIVDRFDDIAVTHA